MSTKNAMLISGLPQKLISSELISEESALATAVNAKQNRKSFIAQAVEDNVVSGHILATLASQEFGAPYLDITAFNPDEFVRGIVDDKLIKKHNILPLIKRDKKLSVALSDPANFTALDEVKFHTGLGIEAVVVEEKALKAAIEKYLESAAEDIEEGFDDMDEGLEDLDIEAIDENAQPAEEDTKGKDETPVVKFINKILLDAIRMGASDIHFEPYEKTYRVRFRADGILQEKAKPPITLSGRISARLKVMSGMDISERRVPQDGRIKLKLSKTKSIDFRVNTLPTLWGEKIVLRILDASAAKMGIDALGYEEDQKEIFMHALQQPQGMILVTGPTGSGKTVSLYTGLNILNTPERNISTAEDPVEINLEGINQVHVNAKVGLTFSSALRSFLRQDPDIIMVGEIRDLETAEIAIKAAQTGHMVMSTLHTNSAPETITRLINMGVPQFNLATTVSVIIAQRLARRLCKTCAIPADDIPKEILLKEGFLEEELDGLTMKHPNKEGCSNCNNGYKGRVGIYEVVRITPAIASLIMEGANSIVIGKQCREDGFPDLRRSALTKAGAGATSLEEVNRVTKD
ncbi:MAG: type IV pilus assembly protein PilB [Pseudomonadales bacterium]|jgi:type IV pilus assembly protein PilB